MANCYNDLFVLDTDSMHWSCPVTQGKAPHPRAGVESAYLWLISLLPQLPSMLSTLAPKGLSVLLLVYHSAAVLLHRVLWHKHMSISSCADGGSCRVLGEHAKVLEAMSTLYLPLTIHSTA